MRKKIKTILFDWGGVLIEDPAEGIRKYCAEQLGVTTAELTTVLANWEDEFQTGRISEQQLWYNVCDELGLGKSGNEGLWGAAFEYAYIEKRDTLELGRELAGAGLKVGLLSNTEKPAVKFFQSRGYDFFDFTLFSCCEGVKKPQREIYEKAVAVAGTGPEEAIFVDDVAEYVDAAVQCGINGVLFQSPQQVRAEVLELAGL